VTGRTVEKEYSSQPRQSTRSPSFLPSIILRYRSRPVYVCPFVRPSVTSRCSTETAKRRITQKRPHDSPRTSCLVPKISAKLKCRWGGLNAGAVAENWRKSTRSVDNLARSQVYHTEHPPYLSAARSLDLIARVTGRTVEKEYSSQPRQSTRSPSVTRTELSFLPSIILRYRSFSIFKMAAVRDFEFSKVRMAGDRVERSNMSHRAKLRGDR